MQKREFLEFETLTLVPFEKNLIERKLLSKDDLQWLDLYHQNVYRKLGPFLVDGERKWLRKACEGL